MNQTEVLSKLVTIMTPYVPNPKTLETATMETKIVQELGINSARLVDIVLDIEDEFDIAVDDGSLMLIVTLGDAVSLITSKFPQ